MAAFGPDVVKLLQGSQCLSTISIQGCGYFRQAEDTPIFENSPVLCRIWWILDIQSSCGISWCQTLQIKPFKGLSSSSPSLTFIDLHYNLQTVTFWISRTWFSQEHKKHNSSVVICDVQYIFYANQTPGSIWNLHLVSPKFKIWAENKSWATPFYQLKNKPTNWNQAVRQARVMNIFHNDGCTWMVKIPLAPSVCRWISIGAVSPPAVISLWRSFSRASLPLEISSLMNTWWDVGESSKQPEKWINTKRQTLDSSSVTNRASLPLSPSTKTWQQCPAVFWFQPEIHVWRSYLRESGVEEHSDHLLNDDPADIIYWNYSRTTLVHYLVQTLYRWWCCAKAPLQVLSPPPGCCSKTAGWSSTLSADCSTFAADQPAVLITEAVS